MKILNQAFFADDNVATAGGCLASHYLATWILLRGASRPEAEDILNYVVPVGEKEEYVARAFVAVEPYVAGNSVREILGQP